MTEDELAPAAGVRLSLKLQGLDAELACYSCQVSQSGSEYVGKAQVRIQDGRLELSGLDGLSAHALTVLQGLLRNAHRDASEVGWPRRMTRWRKD